MADPDGVDDWQMAPAGFTSLRWREKARWPPTTWCWDVSRVEATLRLAFANGCECFDPVGSQSFLMRLLDPTLECRVSPLESVLCAKSLPLQCRERLILAWSFGATRRLPLAPLPTHHHHSAPRSSAGSLFSLCFPSSCPRSFPGQTLAANPPYSPFTDAL